MGVLLVFCTGLILAQAAWAKDSFFYKEINLIGGYSDKDRWIGKNGMMANSLGFEYYKKFSGSYGDYMTADLQMRVAYDSLKNSYDAWGLEIHNAWLEYKLRPEAKIKIGHFDPAFGLEPVLDTHATLLQTLADDNIGFTKDWGVALKGSFPEFDYKAALQLGSGMSVRRQDGSFLSTIRVGTPASRNLQYGFSMLYGKVLESEGMSTFPKNTLLSPDAVTKKRLGLDAQYLIGPYLFKGEAAYGKNNGTDVLGYLTGIDYTLPRHQNWQVELQYRSWINELNQDSSDDSTITLGTSYKLNQSTTLGAAFSHDINLMGHEEENRFVVQLYFFGA